MASVDIILPVEPAEAVPEVRSVRVADLRGVLKRGVDDFLAMPTHVAFLAGIYALAGLIIFRAAFAMDVLPLLYPLATGFALVGPPAAVGLYELSRRRELGLDTSWRHMFDVVHSPSLRPIAALAALLLVIFAVWIACANAIYVANFGYAPAASLPHFFDRVLHTPQGHNLIVVGNIVGFAFALLTASISVIAFPLLLDRNVGFGAAVATSLRVVAKNPVAMLTWFAIVAALLALGSALFFVGLAVVLPVLGHATWHLYRLAVAPDAGPRPEYHPRPQYKRYGADFPASLFVRSSHRKDDT